ncbi:hypothetical protein KKB44_02500 [Candidatus Micrarchaeota archaeon]|nr:hypothetical protein [Candidatus Micrarchaeota archaeon]
MDETYNQLNRAWKKTCGVLLGREVGELQEFEGYLKRYTDPIEKRTSVISGKEITISSNRLSKNTKVIGYNEINEYAKRDFKLDINKIKDIDSILEELNENICYAGDIVLGNSQNFLNSHRCMNTSYILGCQDVHDGKYTAYTTSIRNPEYSFGCCFGGDIQFCIKVLDPYKQTRCMETFHCNVVSDSYYSASLEDCSGCLFSFNQKNKHNLIGNIQLEKNKFADLKSKLLSEIAETLEKKKTIPSVIEIISQKGDWIG